MPKAEGGDKQKKQKSPSRKAKGQKSRKVRRSETHSSLVFEQFMDGVESRNDLFLAEVTHKMGGGRFTVKDEAGTIYPSIPIIGALALTGRSAHNAAVGTAIGTGSHVLTNATLTKRGPKGAEEVIVSGQIHAVLTSEQARQLRAKMAANKSASSRRSVASSNGSTASTLFDWSNYKNAGLTEKIATRKAGHKATRKVAKAPSRSGSVGSHRSAGSSKGSIILVAGKKVYTDEGEGVHGEELRELKRELAAKGK